MCVCSCVCALVLRSLIDFRRCWSPVRSRSCGKARVRWKARKLGFQVHGGWDGLIGGKPGWWGSSFYPRAVAAKPCVCVCVCVWALVFSQSQQSSAVSVTDFSLGSRDLEQVAGGWRFQGFRPTISGLERRPTNFRWSAGVGPWMS